MPFFHTVKPVLRHIVGDLASKNDSLSPDATGHFYSPESRVPRTGQY